jgi:hypothetical protein
LIHTAAAFAAASPTLFFNDWKNFESRALETERRGRI